MRMNSAWRGLLKQDCLWWAVDFARYKQLLSHTICRVESRISEKTAGCGYRDVPQAVTMNAILLFLGSRGNVRTETLRAFTRQETDQALAKIA